MDICMTTTLIRTLVLQKTGTSRGPSCFLTLMPGGQYIVGQRGNYLGPLVTEKDHA